MFVTDVHWLATLRAISQALKPGGDSYLRAECLTIGRGAGRRPRNLTPKQTSKVSALWIAG